MINQYLETQQGDLVTEPEEMSVSFREHVLPLFERDGKRRPGMYVQTSLPICYDVLISMQNLAIGRSHHRKSRLHSIIVAREL